MAVLTEQIVLAPFLRSKDSSGAASVGLKALWYTVIALLVLCFVDANFNDGHYAIAIVRMARPILAHLGIHI